MCLAIPGQIESMEGDEPMTRMARVRFGQVVREVNMAFLPEAQVGDYVLVHVGMAISRVHEEEAQNVFEYLESIGELEEMENP